MSLPEKVLTKEEIRDLKDAWVLLLGVTLSVISRDDHAVKRPKEVQDVLNDVRAAMESVRKAEKAWKERGEE